MDTVTISRKRQVAISEDVRGSMGIRPGQKVRVFGYGDRIESVPVWKLRAMLGFLKGFDTEAPRE